MRQILAALDRAGAGRKAALATVVHVTGSAYRREGAKMLLMDDGTVVGTVSGGCLEGDVAEAARQVMETGRPRLLHYDMTADDDVVWGLGLGCNGTVDVYVEPVSNPAVLQRERAALESGRRLAVVTVQAGPETGPKPGSRMYVYENEAAGSLGSAAWDELLIKEARDLLQQGASRTFIFPLGPGDAPQAASIVRQRREVLDAAAAGAGVRIFIESYVPPPRVVVFGAGHDAIPVVKFAHEVGFQVEVYDNRPAFATRERFPGAHRVICDDPGAALDHLKFDRFTYVVVMSHNYNHDLAFVRAIWSQPYAYLGILGPWARTERILDDLRRDGLEPQAGLDRLYGPIGLNIGAEGPEQIALAIVAEIIAVHKQRPGAFLRFHRGSIHDDPA